MPRAKASPIVMTPAQIVASYRARAANFRETAAASHLSGVKAVLLARAAEWDKKAEEVLAGAPGGTAKDIPRRVTSP